MIVVYAHKVCAKKWETLCFTAHNFIYVEKILKPNLTAAMIMSLSTLSLIGSIIRRYKVTRCKTIYAFWPAIRSNFSTPNYLLAIQLLWGYDDD